MDTDNDMGLAYGGDRVRQSGGEREKRQGQL